MGISDIRNDSEDDIIYAPVAQGLEHPSYKRQVGGSIPPRSNKLDGQAGYAPLLQSGLAGFDSQVQHHGPVD